MKRRLTLIAILASSSAIAQDVYELPEITLSANLGAIATSDTGAQVEIIEGDEVTENHAAPVTDILGNQPGVYTTSNGPIGSLSTVSIRGTRNYENKVFFDGIDVTDPANPQNFYNFGTLSMGTIERIEIVKGSQSAIYGGNAVGGVITMESKAPNKDGFSASLNVEGGSYDTFALNTMLGYRDERLMFAFNASGFRTDGFSAADEEDGAKEADGFVEERYSLKAEYDITNALTIGVSGFTARSEGNYDGYDFFSGGYVDADNVATTEEVGGRVFLRYQGERTQHEISYALYDVERNYNEEFADYSYLGGRSTIAYEGQIELSTDFYVNMKLEQVEESLEQTGDYGENDQSSTTQSATLGVTFPDIYAVNLNLALRYDHNEDFGSQLTYRAAVAVDLTEDVRAKASIGTGFRAPSLFEANYKTTNNLEAETSFSYDFGLEYHNDRGHIGANYFYIETDNLITYSGIWPDDYYKNVEGVSTRSGFELFGAYALSKNFDIDFAYTNINAEDANGDRLTKIPEHELKFGATARFGDFSIGGDAKFVSNVLDFSGEPLDDYTVANARLAYDLGQGEVYLTVKNLFDEQYQTSRGYGTSDRAYYIGYAVDF